MTTLITITNDFHNTSINLQVEDRGDHYRLSPRQYRRMCETLCGVSGCQCGVDRDPNWMVEPVGGLRSGAEGATVESKRWNA
jgi:hypothetical protein